MRAHGPDALSIAEGPDANLAVVRAGVELQTPRVRVERRDGDHRGVSAEGVGAETFGDVPHARGAVRGGGHQERARGVHPHVQDGRRVRLERAHALARRGVPHRASHGARRGEDATRVLAPREGGNGLGISLEAVHHLAGGHLDDVHRLDARRRDEGAIGAQPDWAAGVEHLEARRRRVRLARLRLLMRHGDRRVQIRVARVSPSARGSQ